MTEIGYVIAAGEDIPEDVTDLADEQTGEKGWSRWVRREADKRWNWCRDAGYADLWRVADPNALGWTTKGLAEEGESQGWAPFRVLAVREQPAEPEPVSTQLYWPVGTAAAIDGLRGVYTTEEAANAAKAEDSRLDVASIYLDRAYPVFPEWDPDPKPAAESESVDLLDLVRQYGVMHAACVGLTDAGAEEPARQHHEQEVALFARIEAEVNRLRADTAKDGVLIKTMAERADEFRTQRDEALAEVERLTAAVASTTSGPLVLSLPSVPDGATALIGGKTGKRWVPTNRGHWWQVEGTTEGMGLALLLAEEGSVSVVMREPRTWKRTEITEDLPAVVDVDGHGRWKLRTDFDGSPMHYDQPGRGERQFRDLLALGDVTEVFDEDGTR